MAASEYLDATPVLTQPIGEAQRDLLQSFNQEIVVESAILAVEAPIFVANVPRISRRVTSS